jgi:hypothetical protein
MLATFALVGTRQTEVHNPALVQVIGGAHDRAGRDVDDHRANAEVEQESGIRRVGVGCEDELVWRALQQGEHLIGNSTVVQIALPGPHE